MGIKGCLCELQGLIPLLLIIIEIITTTVNFTVNKKVNEVLFKIWREPNNLNSDRFKIFSAFPILQDSKTST